MNDKLRALIIWSAAGTVILMIAALGWTLQRLPDANELYGQWAAAEMVISFHKQHHQLPARWEDLRPFYTDEGTPHRNKMNFEELRSTIDIDFAHLAKLEQLADTESPPKALPEVIQPTSRNQAHWSGAEPNQLVLDYFVSLKAPRWQPDVAMVPCNALKFYLVFAEPMTTGVTFTHLRLIDLEKNTPIAGALREVELWSPDAKRLTVWLHPGRQKTGVNLNEDEGPVLIESHRYSLILDHNATTTRGTALAEDVVLSFTAGPAEHRALDFSKWKLVPPHPAHPSAPVEVRFDRTLDWAMAHDAIKADVPGRAVVDETPAGTRWLFTPAQRWPAGQHVIEIDPHLEDMAGNNVLRPFETDATAPPSPATPEPVRLVFEVK